MCSKTSTGRAWMPVGGSSGGVSVFTERVLWDIWTMFVVSE